MMDENYRLAEPLDAPRASPWKAMVVSALNSDRAGGRNSASARIKLI